MQDRIGILGAGVARQAFWFVAAATEATIIVSPAQLFKAKLVREQARNDTGRQSVVVRRIVGGSKLGVQCKKFQTS